MTRSVIGSKNASRPLKNTAMEVVPALRPLLPPANRLLPYLRRIDATRKYTNWGPLASELERRLCDHFGVPGNCVISANSGTAALVGAILATTGRAKPGRPLAIIPAFTFVATAIAVEQCGYRPYLVDVNAETWLLDADRLADDSLMSDVGLVVPVAAFGRPVLQETWLAFRQRTGIPVVIDGAAAFEAVSSNPAGLIGEIPMTISFHATKSFGTGEGGCVVTTDGILSMRATEALNFGFYTSRSSRSASTNGKMSEYHAAVGLAELDSWPQKNLALLAVADRYRQRMVATGLADRLLAAPTVAGCYALFCCSDGSEAARVQKSLTESNIEFRLWYGHGLLKQPYFSDLLHGALVVTDSVAPRTIGLPVAIDLSDTAIDRIASALQRGVVSIV